MVTLYVSLLKKGAKSIDDVPEKIKKEVQAILDAETAD